MPSACIAHGSGWRPHSMRPATGATAPPANSRRHSVADELNRLLRALRPHTKADHNWADSPEGVDALDAIHARIAAKPARRMRSWSVWLPTVGVGTAAAALITAVALSSSPGARPGTTIGRGNAPVPVHLRPAGLLLKQFDSCGQLLAGMRQHTADTIAKNPYVLANF